MAFQLSPGVNVSEIDLTTIVPSVATSIGAFAGPFAWGPAGEIITISDEVRLADRFGKPDSTNYEYWFSAANFLAYSNNLKVVRAANTSSTLNASANGSGVLIKNESDYTENFSTANTSLGPVTAKYAGAIGSSLRVSFCASSQAFSSNLTVTDSLKANAVTAGATVINVQGNANAAANLQIGDLVSVDGGTTYIRVASVNATAITVASAPGAVTEGTAILRKWQYADNFGVAPGTSDYVTAAIGSNDEMHIIVVDEDGKFSNGVANTVLEKFSFVSKASDAKFGDGSTNYYVNVLNDRSRYVWWTSHVPGNSNWGSTAAGTAFDAANGQRNPFYASLSGGADGTIGASQITTAYDYFANPASVDISLIVSGPGNSTVATHLISNIAEVRKDCMVFLSPTKTSVVDNAGSESSSVIAYRDTLTSTSYAVMDSGYKYQFDKYNDVYRWIPLNGDIAGTCARTDLERDPWFSPGGFNRGQIKNVIKLSWNPTKTERDDMYVKGINPVVTFQGEGTVLFGDKTMLSRPSVFDRINVRRLLLQARKLISAVAVRLLFEQNDAKVRQDFLDSVNPILDAIRRDRGLYDFRVTVSNSPEDLDRNTLSGKIYLKPTKALEFIDIEFLITPNGASFDNI